MNIRPTLEEAKKILNGGDYSVLPVSCELYGDQITPIEVLKKLKRISGHCFMLESAENGGKWGRYTFLGYDPKLELTCVNGYVSIKTGGRTKTSETRDPGEEIRRVLKEYRSPKISELPSFTGGFMGYFSYDYIKYGEPTLKLDATDEEGFKDVDLMLFDKVIAFDHFRHKIVLIVNIPCDMRLEEEYQRAYCELVEMADIVLHGPSIQSEPGQLTSDIRELFTREGYCSMVEQAKEHIRNGDIFQVVLSNRLDADFSGSLLDTYRVLRTINPSPYMFYLSSAEVEIAGASPETLVKLENGELSTFPLAGTRPRGKTLAEDEMLERELLSDEKELAEHNMLVDLGRNDLGKISRFGSVSVENYMTVLRFSHVMHIGSTVSGEIREDRDGIDAVAAVLPAGTLSGAPKIRSCEIINKLENNKRGIYGGAIGYLDFTGNMDTCIAIRLAFRKNGKVFIRSGAGIVADSVPEKEYEETINKASAVLKAMRIAQEGLNL